MRCNNCGYDNDPGVSVCVKCGHQLQDAGGSNPNPYQAGGYAPNYGGGAEPAPRPTVIGATGMQEPQPKPTMIGAAGAAMAEPMPRPTRVMNGPMMQEQVRSAANQGGNKACPTCGYPVMGDFAMCPSCGAQLKPQPAQVVSEAPARAAKPAPVEEEMNIVTTCDACGKEVPASYAHCPYCGEKIHQKTVFVRRHHVEPPKPKCSLALVPEENEQVERVNDYEGASIMLNRENTEPNNRSITSKVQAELICEDDKWYILNHSELCSTVVEANRKIELQPGDIIVLGDRRFKFEKK